jgi:hypothetical protein
MDHSAIPCPQWDELHHFGCGIRHINNLRQTELEQHVRACKKCTTEANSVHSTFTKLLRRLKREKMVDKVKADFCSFMGIENKTDTHK